jgi:hypothetical protein
MKAGGKVVGGELLLMTMFWCFGTTAQKPPRLNWKQNLFYIQLL